MTVAEVVPNPPLNITSFNDLIVHIGNITGVSGGYGTFGYLILVMIAGMTFLMTGKRVDRGMIFSGLVTGVMAVFFRFLNLISDGILLFWMVYAIIGIIVLMAERHREEGNV